MRTLCRCQVCTDQNDAQQDLLQAPHKASAVTNSASYCGIRQKLEMPTFKFVIYVLKHVSWGWDRHELILEVGPDKCAAAGHKPP